MGKFLSLFVATFVVFYANCAGNETIIRPAGNIKTYYEPNGYKTDGHPAVGSLNYFGDTICNIILIQPTLALTARHCTDEWNKDLPFFVFTAEWGGSAYLIADVKPFPGAGKAGRTDVSLVVLSTPVGRIRPIKVSSYYPRPNARLVFVGRGCSPYGGVGDKTSVYEHGTKREITVRVPGILNYEHFDVRGFRLCPGDSGGALINRADYSLVGIGSAAWVRRDRQGNPHYIAAMFGDPILFTVFIRFSEALEDFRGFAPFARMF